MLANGVPTASPGDRETIGTPRLASLAPISRTTAQDLLRQFEETLERVEDRVTRARCWRALQLYDPAWNELAALEPQLPPGQLRARVRSELLILSYYLARPVDEETFGESIDREAGSDLYILTDLHLGRSLRATARNDLHVALREVYFSLDLAKEAYQQHGEIRALLPPLRLRAHLLAQAGSYREALRASADAVRSAQALDPWELGWSVYTRGFVLWCQGRPQDAIREFDRALELTSSSESSLPRWIRASRARALAMLGRVADAEVDLASSSYQLPEDIAYLAIAQGEPLVANLALEAHLQGRDPFVLALHGIAQVLLGHTRQAEEDLLAAHERFSAGGLMHYSLSARVHLAFCRAQRRNGSGRTDVLRLAAEILSRGAQCFAWPHRAVVSWVTETARDAAGLTTFARGLDARRSTAPLAVQLREHGLTDRETEVALRILERRGRGRGPVTSSRHSLAAELSISENTLRVHLMRIREKLGIVGRRGDDALADIVEGWTDDPSATRLR